MNPSVLSVREQLREQRVVFALAQRADAGREGDAGRAELCRSCAAGGLCTEAAWWIICVALSGLSLLRWFNVPASERVALLSLSNTTLLWMQEKCSLFSRPTNKSRAFSGAHL